MRTGWGVGALVIGLCSFSGVSHAAGANYQTTENLSAWKEMVQDVSSDQEFIKAVNPNNQINGIDQLSLDEYQFYFEQFDGDRAEQCVLTVSYDRKRRLQIGDKGCSAGPVGRPASVNRSSVRVMAPLYESLAQIHGLVDYLLSGKDFLKKAGPHAMVTSLYSDVEITSTIWLVNYEVASRPVRHCNVEVRVTSDKRPRPGPIQLKFELAKSAICTKTR